MKKKVKLLASLLVLVLLCGSYFGVKTYVRKQEEKEEQEAAEEEKSVRLISEEIENVKNLKFVADKKEVSFKKDGEEWKLQEDADFPVNQESLDEAVSILKNMEADRVLEDVEDLAEYGLDAPLNSICFSGDGEEEENVIRVGMENDSTKQYYVSVGDEKSKVYVVPEVSISPFMKNLYEYAEAQEFPFVDASLINEVDVEKSSGYAYRIVKDEESAEETWNIEDGENVDKTDSAKISTLTSTIGALAFDRFVNYKSTNDEEYGLENPAAVITVKYEAQKEVSDSNTNEEENESSDLMNEIKENEISETEDEGENSEEAEPVYEDKELVLYIGDKTEDGSYYVKIGDNQEIYTMNSENVEAIIGKEYKDYLDLTVYYLAISNLERLDIEMDGETHCINVSRETSEDDAEQEKTETTYQIDGEELDSTSFSTFFNKMTNMTAQERLMSDYSPESEPKISIKVKNTEGNTTNLQYYEYDTNYYAVVVEEKVYLVNKMSIRELMTAYNAILGVEGDVDQEMEESE